MVRYRVCGFRVFKALKIDLLESPNTIPLRILGRVILPHLFLKMQEISKYKTFEEFQVCKITDLNEPNFYQIKKNGVGIKTISKHQTFEDFKRVCKFTDSLFENAGNFIYCKENGVGIETILKFLGKPWKEWMIRDALKSIAINYHAEQAKKRQGTRTDLKTNIREPVHESDNLPKGRSDDQVGKLFNVSGRSVSSAKYIMEHGTEEEKGVINHS